MGWDNGGGGYGGRDRRASAGRGMQRYDGRNGYRGQGGGFQGAGGGGDGTGERREFTREEKERGFTADELMPFGRYAGCVIQGLPVDYMAWFVGKVQDWPGLVACMRGLLGKEQAAGATERKGF